MCEVMCSHSHRVVPTPTHMHIHGEMQTSPIVFLLGGRPLPAHLLPSPLSSHSLLLALFKREPP